MYEILLDVLKASDLGLTRKEGENLVGSACRAKPRLGKTYGKEGRKLVLVLDRQDQPLEKTRADEDHLTGGGREKVLYD